MPSPLHPSCALHFDLSPAAQVAEPVVWPYQPAYISYEPASQFPLPGSRPCCCLTELSTSIQAGGLLFSERWRIETFSCAFPQRALSVWRPRSTRLERPGRQSCKEGPEILLAGAQPGPLALADTVPKNVSFAHGPVAC